MSSESKFQLTVAQICLANAGRDEANEHYRFGVRQQHYIDLLNAYSADVYCIKELRPCLNKTATETLSVDQILTSFTQGRSDRAVATIIPLKPSLADSPKQFYLAQIFNPEKLRLISADARSYGKNIDYQYLQVQYQHLESGQSFSVASIHFPMDNQTKTQLVEHFSSKPLPFTFLIGDFNFFTDDPDHEQHLKSMESSYAHITNMENERGEAMFGTFQPFPHDKPPVEIEAPWNCSTSKQKQNSALDHVFVGEGLDVSHAKITLIEGSDRSTLKWDHLPMFVQFQ